MGLVLGLVLRLVVFFALVVFFGTFLDVVQPGIVLMTRCDAVMALFIEP